MLNGVEITFLGAAETVTGSRFLVEVGGGRVLVDCGLFQGLKRLRELNWAPFAVDPRSIDAVLLTHAHVDHSGYLPALVRDGFRGRIWCTPSSLALGRILLRDAAHLQEEDARYANEKRSSRHHPALPLYTRADAEAALDRFQPHGFDVDFQPVRGLTARFTPAGHILGAASVRIEEGGASVLFSGDLGREDDPIMRPPAAAPAASHVVVESTYGNRAHPSEDVLQILGDVIRRTAERGGIILVPAFAVGRTQTVLHLLARLRASGQIPELPTFVNSPMAVTATELLLASATEHRLSPQEVFELSDGVRLVREVEESKQLTTQRGPMIVVTASGMLTGGRVLHHLLQVGPDHRSTIILPGFQAAGTRGQSLLDGARTLRVFGQDVPIRAQVVHLEGLSAHADGDGIISWLKSAPEPPAGVSVVHGEPAAADALRRRVEHELGWPARVPAVRDTIKVRPG